MKIIIEVLVFAYQKCLKSQRFLLLTDYLTFNRNFYLVVMKI